jgi:hypothetical protein
MAKGKSWTSGEDVALAKAWVSVSENAVTGSEQKSDKFWTNIHSVSKLAHRTQASLKQRWSTLSHSVSKFLAAFEQVKILNPSGKTLEDMMEDAWDLCSTVCKLDKESCFSCYEVLNSSPKWMEFDSPPSEDSKAAAKRPQGNKAAKEEDRESKKQKTIESSEEFNDIGKRIATNLDRKNDYLREMIDLQLFSRPEIEENIRRDFLNALAKKRIDELNKQNEPNSVE